MRVIASMRTPNENIVELVESGGIYRTRLYVYEADSDHELTPGDAREFVAVVRSCGGLVHGNLTPQTAAS